MLPIKIAYCFLHMETAKSSKDTEVKVLKKKITSSVFLLFSLLLSI